MEAVLSRLPWAAAFLFLGISAVPAAPGAVTLDEAVKRLEAMTWYSEEYPPFNYQADGKAAGMSVDILMAAFQKIGVDVTPADIEIVPWNRSYNFVRNRPGTALFVMTYSEERERIMKFVGPALPSRVSIIAPRDKGLSIDSPEDLAGLKIGVVREDIGDQLLRAVAPDGATVSKRNTLKALFYLMNSGRVDAVSYSLNVFRHAAREAGEDPNRYVELLVLKEAQLGYAFHNATNPAVLAPLQKALDELKADGTVDRIVARYTD